MSLSQQLPQLIEHLMSLQDYYQVQLIESEQKAKSTLEQLSHVNALLVDSLGDVGQFMESLMELRSHLQTQLRQHQQQAAIATEQLSHIQPLLTDQLISRSQKLPIATTTVVPQPHSVVVEEPPEPLQIPTTESIPQIPSAPTEDQDEDSTLTPSASTEAVDEDEDSTVAPATTASVEGSEELTQPYTPTKTQMLPQYQNLSKIQAVERLLRENASSILHVDSIIRALYGELEPSEIKAEKPRMYDTLTQGTKKGLWEKVPDIASCYTYDLKLVPPASVQKINSSATHKRRLAPLRGKNSEQMLPDYQHLNFTAAIETVVNKYAGEILTTEKIATELYGKLSAHELTIAKDKIGKILWSGAKQGRWQHVPGQLGCYTLDMSTVISH